MIPDEPMTSNINECAADLTAHQKRVNLIVWHPTAHLVLLSASKKYKVLNKIV